MGLGRDPVRTPMPWDGLANAGFTTGEPWLPLNPDWPTRNVAAQEVDPTSMLSLYRSLLALRRDNPALSVGEISGIHAEDEVLRYERHDGGRRFLIALNLCGEERRFVLPEHIAIPQLVLSTVPAWRTGGEDGDGRTLLLAPDEGVILRDG